MTIILSMESNSPTLFNFYLNTGFLSAQNQPHEVELRFCHKIILYNIGSPPTELEQHHSPKTTLTSPKPWLFDAHSKIQLTEIDRNIIISGEELNDNHINFAQELLKRQFRTISGLQTTLFLSRLKETLPATNCVQVVHCRGSHWIVASTIGCSTGEVLIFDSLYSSVDPETRELLKLLFGTDAKVKLETCPQQVGNRDCGVFAIAISTSLANGEHPGCISFDQESMRRHLLNCFELFQLTLFH